MILSKDLYTQVVEAPLTLNNDTYGTTVIRYEIREVTDVRNLTQTRRYHILCTQRIVIPNSTQFNLTPSSSTAFENYPAILSNEMVLNNGTNSSPRILSYSPRTINTSIMTSANQSSSDSSSYSQQHTSGSSTSQTNTYGYAASVGFSGEDVTGSVSADYSHSSTKTQDKSATTGSDKGTGSERGGSDSMSIKDWGCYASLDAGNVTPTWFWGQEYPWDIIQYRYCPTNNNVELPDFVKIRLFDTSDTPNQVFPPSQLSLFGLDFTMKSMWEVELSPTVADQSVTIKHQMNYVTATHMLSNGAPIVQLDPAPMGFSVTSPALDLTLLGLDPILNGGDGNGAVLGFVANKFISPPSKGDPFKIISAANNLQVTGSGFDGPLFTSFDSGPVQMKIQFKVIDVSNPYTLYFKNWTSTGIACMLSFVFNGDTENPVIRYVDSQEGEGGDDNLLSLNLRNHDYSSIDYHDYLVMGLNTIDVTITPVSGGAAGYVLRALAIGQN